MDDVRLLDSHLHLWDPDHLHYAWLEGPLAARHDVAELTAALQDAPAVSERAFVFVQADCAPEQAVDEVDWVVERAGVADIRGVVAFAPVERPSDLDDVLARLCKRPLVRGIRRLLQGEDRGFALSPEFLAGAHAIARAGLTFDACVRHDQLADVVALADAVPELTIVLDHLGKPDLSSAPAARWMGDIAALAERENTVAKISGLPAEARGPWTPEGLRPYLDVALEAFGPERLMFGGDWPVSTPYGRWARFVTEWSSRLDPGDRDAILWSTAERTYRLSAAA